MAVDQVHYKCKRGVTRTEERCNQLNTTAPIVLAVVMFVISIPACAATGVFKPCLSHADCDKFDEGVNVLFCRKISSGISVCDSIEEGEARGDFATICADFPNDSNAGPTCGAVVCPKGKFGAKTVSVPPHNVVWYPNRCTDCPAGSFASKAKSEFCQCPPLGHRGNPSQDGEEECPAGTFNNVTLPLAEAWRPSIAQTRDGYPVEATPCGECKHCKPGSYSGVGASECLCTDSGREALEDGTGFRLCKPGTYKHSSNCNLCKQCEAGKYALKQGEEHCSNPTIGHYASDSGSRHSACEPGTYKEGRGTRWR